MDRSKFLFVLEVVALAFLITFIPTSTVSAARLVSCTGPDCNICEFVNSIQLIIDYMIYTLALPIGAITIAYAGFKYAFAQGDVGAIKSAHGLFRKAFLGLLIALSAWLMVDFAIRGLVTDSFFSGMPWDEINCTNALDADDGR